jgi:O-antigen/teichoic acid export membrane protein
MLKNLKILPTQLNGKSSTTLDSNIETEPRGLSLKANFIWTLAGNLVYSGCQWGMLVIIAKVGSAELVGQFALGLAITAPVLMFSNLQMRGVQATDAKREYSFGDYLGLRLITTLLALLIIAGIILVSGYGWETALVVLLVGVAKAFEAVSDIFYGLLQQYERMNRIAISMVLRGFLALAVLGLIIFFTHSMVWGVLGMALSWGLVLVFYDLWAGNNVLASALKPGEKTGLGKNYIAPRWHWPNLLKLTWLALPLGLVMMFISLNTNLPRYFLEHYSGERELGIFAALSYLVIVGNTIVGALGQAASPRLSRHYAAGDKAAFRSLMVKLALLGGFIGLAGALVALVAGPLILTIFYRSEYAAYSDVFFWLMVVAGFGYVASFLGYGLTAARYFRSQLPLFAASCGLTLLGCAWLVPGQLLLGATLALGISTVFQLLGSIAILMHALRHTPTEPEK